MSANTLDGMSVAELDTLIARATATKEAAIQAARDAEWVTGPVVTEAQGGFRQYRIRRADGALETRNHIFDRFHQSAHDLKTINAFLLDITQQRNHADARALLPLMQQIINPETT